jgi:UPF0755 protein
MRRLVRYLALLLVAIALIAAGVGAFLKYEFTRPGALERTVRLVIKRGSGTVAIARHLEEAGLIPSAQRFLIEAQLFGDKRLMKAGEYDFDYAESAADLLRQIQDGRTVVRRLTIPEGLTVGQALALVSSAEALEGSVPNPAPPEGSLLPETYNYSWGDSRAELVLRMRRAMDEALEAAWAKRKPDLPLASAHDLLTLASIVEKETGIEAERPHVAAVFLNRLKSRMRLQADPTVAYGLTHDGTALGRKLTHADIEASTPFNTYQHDGLPPTPIANPGKAALAAVAQPAPSDDLYFVADGSGGHVFARTLDEHNRHVSDWRKLQQGKAQ